MSRDRHDLDRLFRYCGTALRLRHGGRSINAPDWLDPEAVQALVMPLDGLQQWTAVLRDGVSPRALPASLAWGGGRGSLPLRKVRGEAARAQSGPPRVRPHNSTDSGVATALVRDLLNPQRNYLLSCAHVLAPDASCAQNDLAYISLNDGEAAEGRLCEWAPALGEGCPSSTIDAALLELDTHTTLALREHQAQMEWQPDSVSDLIAANKPVALRRPGGPLAGNLVVRWSGQVDIGDDDYPDYFLQDAIGYTTHGDDPHPGDSGSPVWTEERALLGMHLAGIDPQSAYGASGLMGRIQPVLDWFRIKPYTRLDPASLQASDHPGATNRRPGPAAAAPLRGDSSTAADRIVLAQTLWGEARGEGIEGMRAVACVIMSRALTHYRSQHSIAAVCQDPWQFSCWNLDDPNRAELDRVTRRYDASFAQALAVADEVMRPGWVNPFPSDVRHYVASSLRQRPGWLQGRQPYEVIGRHEFYQGIA